MPQSTYNILFTFYSNYRSLSRVVSGIFNIEKCRDLEISSKYALCISASRSKNDNRTHYTLAFGFLSSVIVCHINSVQFLLSTIANSTGAICFRRIGYARFSYSTWHVGRTAGVTLMTEPVHVNTFCQRLVLIKVISYRVASRRINGCEMSLTPSQWRTRHPTFYGFVESEAVSRARDERPIPIFQSFHDCKISLRNITDWLMKE